MCPRAVQLKLLPHWSLSFRPDVAIGVPTTLCLLLRGQARQEAMLVEIAALCLARKKHFLSSSGWLESPPPSQPMRADNRGLWCLWAPGSR